MAAPLPSPPPEWSDDHFRDAAMVPAAAPAGLGRGMVGHVPIVAVLLLIQGVLELIFAAFGALFIGFLFLAPVAEAEELRGFGVIMALLAVAALLAGVLRIVAGWANLRFRQRTLGMAALMIGLASVFTFYCAPTAIGLAVYGLVVYLNEPVVAAFELGERGTTFSEIQAAFPPDEHGHRR